MMDNLPKGKKNEKLRRYIYDEKSLFLNRGEEKNDSGYRGSDERMTYIDNFLDTAFNVVVEWLRTGANPFDLYIAFYNLNEEKGFHKKKSDPTTEQASIFDKQLKGLVSVPPAKKDR